METPSLWRILLHLYAFAQLGVLTRIVIGRLFSGKCSGNGHWYWAPCVTGSGLMETGSTFFYDFPANVLGCFVIGLLSSGSTLASTFPRLPMPAGTGALQLMFVPADSSLQAHSALHIGLRTGYCGSLTTFSSWFMQVTILMVGRGMPPSTLVGTQWPQALWAIYVGLAGALLGLIVGQHTALAILALIHARTRRHKPTQRLDLTLATIPPAPEPGTPEAEADPVAAEVAGEGRGRSSITGPREPGSVVVQVDGAKAEAAGTATKEPGTPSAPGEKPPFSRSLACRLADLAALASLMTLTGVSAAYAYLDSDTDYANDRRFWWLSILFGPAGGILRWYLSRFNGVPAQWTGSSGAPGGWAWLHLGTFAANTLACVLDYVCEALLFRLPGSLTNTQRVALQGLMVGTAGCLSTVSTWVVELQKLSISSPLGAYYYFTSSSVVAVALGLLIYGIPAWTAPRA